MDRKMAVIDIAKRIITLFIILFLIATVNFVLFRVLSEHGVMPRTNDPILIDQINSRYHLKYSLFEQYVFYLWNTMNLDFGISTTRMKGVEISDIIVPYLERSLWMFGIVGALTVLAGVSYEAIASGMKRRGSRMTTHLIALIFLSAPALGLTMLAVDINTRLEYPLPLESIPYNPLVHGGGDMWDRIYYNISHGVLPAAICILLTFGYIPLFFKGVNFPGLGPRSIWRGIVRVLGFMRANPLFTKFFFAWIVTCVFFVDAIFFYHGLGALLWDSLSYFDIPLVMASFLALAAILAIANCVFDIISIAVPKRAETPTLVDTAAQDHAPGRVSGHEPLPLASSVRESWSAYRTSRAGVAALVVFVAIAFVAIAAPLLTTV